MSAQHEYSPIQPISEYPSVPVPFNPQELHPLTKHEQPSPAQTINTIKSTASAIARTILNGDRNFGPDGAHCVGSAEYFFDPEIEPGTTLTKIQKKAFSDRLSINKSVAKLLCDKCPVRANCLEEVLSLDIRIEGRPITVQGIWAGTTERERARLQSRRAVKSLYTGTITN